MSGHQQATIEDTVYFWFAANDTSGSGGDGATPLFDVREAGAAASAAPLLSGTPSLLSNAAYPAGCHEIAVAATAGNGFAANDTFAVFCTLAVDSQNPSGFVGSCTLTPLATAAALAIVDGNVDDIETDTNELQSVLSAGILARTNNPTLNALLGVADVASTNLADAIWEEILTGATHNVANSAGKRLRQIDAAFEIHSGTAEAGSTSTTINLEAATADNTTDEIYAGDRCVIVAGTGKGEHGLILSYNSTTQIAAMSKAWNITPTDDSEYILTPADVDVELWNDNSVTGDGDWAQLVTAVGAIPTTAMRGTDSAALASVATEARLAELDAANLPADLDTVVAGTADVQSRLPAALVSGRMNSDVEAINDTAASAVRLALSTGQIIPGTVDTTGFAPTTTEFECDDITEATADHFNGGVVIWTTGALAGQKSDITDYALVGGRGHFTVTALTEAPADDVTMVIV